MSDISFGFTVGMLKNAMAGASEAHGIIANNVANINTPNFKRADLSFKEALAATEPRTEDSPTLALAVTNGKDIAEGPEFEAVPFAPEVKVDPDEVMRNDGSNVDLDQEMAKLSLNSSYSQAMSQFLGVQYSRLRQAIQEHF